MSTQRYETVGDALEAVDLPPDHYDHAEGYEQCVRPLKLTGGKLSLRVVSTDHVDHPEMGWYITRAGSGRLERVREDAVVVPNEMREFIRSTMLAVEPFLTREVPE